MQYPWKRLIHCNGNSNSNSNGKFLSNWGLFLVVNTVNVVLCFTLSFPGIKYFSYFVLFIFLQIQLVLGPESSIAVGWQKREEKMSAAGELKVCPNLHFSDAQNFIPKF